MLAKLQLLYFHLSSSCGAIFPQ